MLTVVFCIKGNNLRLDKFVQKIIYFTVKNLNTLLFKASSIISSSLRVKKYVLPESDASD